MSSVPAPRRPLGRPRIAEREPGPFGRALRAYRDARDLTLVQVATIIGVQASTICRWEAGRARPSGCVRAAVEREIPTLRAALARDGRKSNDSKA